ncbi:hypothetical protein Bpfe_031385 [Biomphalaria pfeifferi]|uniref:Uncharacterized protein n=1 Tax=Biomphalaria pfeifferi TaxID=112525 RepID=A0AAD8EUE6_BIOPF|nr:hypothetical protein Bpfe_031385 [Biomphalaria pfeifferi]
MAVFEVEKKSRFVRFKEMLPFDFFSEDMISVFIAINLSELLSSKVSKILIVEGSSLLIFLTFMIKWMYRTYVRSEQIDYRKLLGVVAFQAIYMCGIHCLLLQEATRCMFSPLEQLILNSAVSYLNMAAFRYMFCEGAAFSTYKSVVLLLGALLIGLSIIGLIGVRSGSNLFKAIGFSGLAVAFVSSIKEDSERSQEAASEKHFLLDIIFVVMMGVNYFLFCGLSSQALTILESKVRASLFYNPRAD